MQNNRTRGAETQTRILERAVQIASSEGLDAMSLATLANATNMSKSGLFAHFRSKEALQVAIIDEADRLFRAAVVSPTSGLTGGARLSALIDNYITYNTGSVFEGGCFFAAAMHEFDGRPGPVRDRLQIFHAEWLSLLREAVLGAQAAGDVGADVNPDHVVLWTQGLGLSLNLQVQMDDRDRAVAVARAAADAFLGVLNRQHRQAA